LSKTTRRTTALLAAALTASAALTGTGAAAQPAPPNPAPAGDNGTVKVHRSTTAADDPRNEPHVCGFYLAGFNFDPAERVGWRIVEWAPTGSKEAVKINGTLVLDANGHGRTTDLSLADGHYKLYWNFAGENGFAKQKVFWVECDRPPAGPPGNPDPSQTPTMTPAPTPSVSPTDPASPPTATPAQTPSEGTGQPGDSMSPPVERAAQPEEMGGDLPLTGFAGRLIAALGAALILGGAGAILLARRRRGRHSGASG
jgi:LPXTG-motif cell wall-anchored protein